jgi:LPXTG-site transpeptidase (sortase) family protein
MRLEIDSINLEEQVEPTYSTYRVVDDRLISKAVVPDTGIAWVQSTALPGMGDNIFMVGHNSKAAFGRLDEVQLGNEISVWLDGVEHKYYVVYKLIVPVVTPEKGGELFVNIGRLLGPMGHERLTLLTCHGKGSTHRLIVIGKKR